MKREKRFLFSLTGSVTLLGGVFAPALSVPALGEVSYFSCGSGDGTALIALALLSLLLALKRKFTPLWYTGASSFGVIVFMLLNIHFGFSALSTDIVQTSHFSWGWALLIFGAGMVTTSSTLRGEDVA